MDTPEQFIKDVMTADAVYAEAFDSDLFIGNFRATELLGIPEAQGKTIIGFLTDETMSDVSHRNARRIEKEIHSIIDNPPSCLREETTYQALQYLTKVEGPWAVRLINKTFLKDHIKVPDGALESMDRFSRIPQC